jgi:transcriptional regulator with XRE-family HTH domain
MKQTTDEFSKTVETLAAIDSTFKKEWDILDQVERLVDELVAERKRQNISQRDLAKRSGLKQEAIARMETMQAIPRLDTFLKAASALKCELSFRNRSHQGDEQQREEPPVYLIAEHP